MPKINPFKPNSPVSAGMFAGRFTEIETLEKGLHQTKYNHPINFLITGERGIGKSSLLTYIKFLANGEITSPDYNVFNFLTVNIVISERTTLANLITLIEHTIKREVGKLEKIRNFLNETWSFVQRIKVMDSGIEQKNRTEDTDILLDDFVYSLSETCKRITNPEKGEIHKDGIVFFIDEADKSSQDLHIGYFFKLITEKLQQYDCNNIMFLVAGLPETIEKLSISHESSLRVFSDIKIKTLTVEDRHYVIEKGIESGNKINKEPTSIADDAKNHISTLSEGYPHFIQQFAYSAFDFNTDGVISAEDVLSAAFDKNGALDAIGSRYYESSYYEQIKSDEYRQVLSIMADKMDSWIPKQEIKTRFTGSEQRFNNALQALTTRRIILRNSSKRGEYRLQQRGFALWIMLFGKKEK